MTIAELVAELEKIKEEYGNLNVNMSMSDGGDIGVITVNYFREEDEEKSVILY